MIHLKPFLAESVSDRSVVGVPVVGFRTKMYALPTEPKDKSYALCPYRTALRGNGVGRKRCKKPQRTSSRQKYWMTHYALFYGHRSRFCFSLSLSLSIPCSPLFARYILRTPGFQPTFCFALDAEWRDAKEIVSRSRDLSPNFATRELARNFAVYGELINAVCADEKMLFAKFTREFLGWIKNMQFKRNVLRE